MSVAIEHKSEWWYQDGDTNYLIPSDGLPFHDPDFVPDPDAGWRQGEGVFGYGGHLDGLFPRLHRGGVYSAVDDDDFETTLAPAEQIPGFENPTFRNKTYYFLRDFTLPDVSTIKRLKFTCIREDACVIWINGVIVVRCNVVGDFRHGENAKGANGNEGHPDCFELLRSQAEFSALQTGTNRICVALFNVDPRSSDCGFDLKLEVNPDPDFWCSVMPCGVTGSHTILNFETQEEVEVFAEYGPDELNIAKYSTLVYCMKFWRDKFKIPANWKRGQGIFYFGDPSSPFISQPHTLTTPIVADGRDNRSYYFRRNFTLTDHGDIEELGITVFRDDAYVMWINGVEVSRSGGLVDVDLVHGLVAPASDESQPYKDILLEGSALDVLREGENNISVMLFNSGAGQSDAGFDLFMNAVSDGGSTETIVIPWASEWDFDDSDIDWFENGAIDTFVILRVGTSSKGHYYIKIPNGEPDFQPGGLVWYRLRYRRNHSTTDYNYTDSYVVGRHHNFRLARPYSYKGPWMCLLGHDSREKPQEQGQPFLDYFWPCFNKLDEDFAINGGDTYNAIKGRTASLRSIRGPEWGMGRENNKGGDCPTFMCLGNHEEDWRPGIQSNRKKRWPLGAFLSLPGQQTPIESGSWQEGYYYWTWGETLFIALNNEDYQHWVKNFNYPPGGSILYSKQRRWLEQVLDAHRHYKWKIVFHHRQIDAVEPGHGSDLHLREHGFGESHDYLMSLFRIYGVQLFLNGHYHGWHVRKYLVEPRGPELLITRTWFLTCTWGSPLYTHLLYDQLPGPAFRAEYKFMRLRFGQRWTGNEWPFVDNGDLVDDTNNLVIEVLEATEEIETGGKVVARWNVDYRANPGEPNPEPPEDEEDVDLGFVNQPMIFAVGPQSLTCQFTTVLPTQAFLVYGHDPRRNWWQYPYRTPLHESVALPEGFQDHNTIIRLLNTKLQSGGRIYYRLVGRIQGIPRWTFSSERSIQLALPQGYGASWWFAFKADEHLEEEAAEPDQESPFEDSVLERLAWEDENGLHKPDFYLNGGDIESAGIGFNDARVNDHDDEARQRYVRIHSRFWRTADDIPFQGMTIGDFEGESRYWGQESMDLGAKWRTRFMPGFDNGPSPDVDESEIDLYRQRAYHFTWGDACFLVLSGLVANDPSGPSPTPPRLTQAKKEWIIATLQRYHDLGYLWKIVVDHTPMRGFSDGQSWNDNPEDRDWLEEQFDKYGVQLYLCGHTHQGTGSVEDYDLTRACSRYWQVISGEKATGHFRIRVGYRAEGFQHDNPRYTTLQWIDEVGSVSAEWVVWAGVNPGEAARNPVALAAAPEQMLKLNHAGDSVENPIVAGFAMRVQLHKTGAADALKRCWLTLDGRRGPPYLDLTARCVVEDERVHLDLLAGQDLIAGTPPRLNVLHFSTSSGHYTAGVYVAQVPPHKVELDGYDAEDQQKPLIWAVYQLGGEDEGD